SLFREQNCGSVHAYNVVTGKWRPLENMIPRSGHAMTVVNESQIVICGGIQYSNLSASCIRLIDPINNPSAMWQSDIPDMPLDLAYHALIYFDEQLVVLGGIYNDGKQVFQVLLHIHVHIFSVSYPHGCFLGALVINSGWNVPVCR